MNLSRLVRCFLVSIPAALTSGCGGFDHREIGENLYLVTGYVWTANEGALADESRRLCPAGYQKLAENHSRVAEGPTLEWRIHCYNSN